MTARTKKMILATAAATLVVALVAFAVISTPASAQAAPSTTTSNSSIPTVSSPGGTWVQFPGRDSGPLNEVGPPSAGWGPTMPGASDHAWQQANFTVGQSFTITSSQGRYTVVGTSGDNGTASGTLTFTVTAKLSGGFTLSMASGSVTMAGTTYTITSGAAQMNPAASGITGQGETSPTGHFLLQASASGSFAGSTGRVSLDLQSGSSEYLVVLSGSVSA